MEYWFVASGVLSCGCMGKSKRIIWGIFQLAMFEKPEGEATSTPKKYKI